ncbi:MAG: Lipopolysaccharide core biosynthesis protein RfaG [Chlamydiia bacterium]|nr:Lipopolysaccharide core biosynthesis protein RfaG [Chlamydiia bacterium]
MSEKKNKKVYILKQRLGSYGGLEKYTYRIAEAFSKKGCDVTLLSGNEAKKVHNHPHFDFKTFPTPKHFSLRRLEHFDANVRRYLKSQDYDLVFGLDRTRFQTHIRAGNGVHKIFLKRRKSTSSFLKRMSLPINPLHKLILSIEKHAFEHPKLECLFTNSNMVKNEILSNFAVDEKKVHVVHNGVEWNDMQKDFDIWLERKAKVASSLHLDPASYHFLFIGNDYKRKGLDILLQALSILKNKDVHLSVVGKDKNIKSYISLAEKLGISKNVSFYGPQNDVRKFFQLSDCLIIPSFYDPFANVTIEALAMGLFVISSPYNGGHEILSNETGITLETLEDPTCLASAMERAISVPKTWIHATAIRNSVKHLDFSNQIGNLIDISLSATDSR